jgi:adenosylcobinamide-GDP ribazoletransferase
LRALRDLVSAFMLLTRLPVGRFGGSAAVAGCIWAFPIVGFVVNGVGGLVYWIAVSVRVPPLLAAVWALAVTVAMTGAMHEDGLADTADGFGGGSGRLRKLEIMRDSRIGTFGAMALLLSLVMRAVAIAAPGRPAAAVTAMVLAGMIGRSAMIMPLLLLTPARIDGMGAAVGRPGGFSVAVGSGVSVVATFAMLRPWPAMVAVGLGFGSAIALAELARRQIGGYTGDILGATEVVAECVVLTVMAALSVS